MTGIILCPKAKNFIEPTAESGSAALIDLCGMTVLERTLDNLIACGLKKAYIVCDDNNKKLEKIVKRYINNDKIDVSFETSEIANEKQIVICDVLPCSDKSVIELIKSSQINTCITDEKEGFVFAKTDIKREDLTRGIFDIPYFLDLCGKLKRIRADIRAFNDIKDLLAYQVDLLDGSSNDILSLTNSNFNGVTIISPVFIGKNVTVSSGAVIGRGSVISDGARIGKGARVLGSYIGKCAVVGKNCSVENAFVSTNASLMNRVWLCEGAIVCADNCVRSNSHILENSVVSSSDTDYNGVCFKRGDKQLEFDDDGICSLFDGTTDVSSYVRLGKAIGSSLSVKDKVVCGCGSNEDFSMLADALICGVRSTGVDVLYLTECTVAQLGFAVQRSGSKIGVFVGVDANGDIRLVDKCALPLVSALEEDICNSYNSKIFRTSHITDIGEYIPAESEKTAYEAFLSKIMPKRLSGINVSVRTNDLTAARLCDRIITPANDLNGERIVFQLSNDITAVNAYSDSTGNIRWEQLCLLCCRIMFSDNKPVSLPYSIPSAAERSAELLQGSVYRYCTVNAGANDVKAREIACQSESSFVRDALLLTVMICRYLNGEKISLKEALMDTRQVCCVQRFINLKTDRIFELENAKAVGDEGVILSDMNTSAFVRPSKNRDSLIIFAESTNTEFAASFCDSIIEKLRKNGVSD